MMSYSLPEKLVKSMSLKHNFQVKFFNSNCIEMGVEAVEMDLQYSKL